ncbi:polyprenyl synthetase family protein [Aliifodinibius sp. S!AR15-10]|uniref:polyprenyl synthetase family protein n=1 Tax=Aliifodinibius sp. S!AR15-10 TaxID=2950437 RepID=UPI0028617CF0|nr:polyprenyl synthetase family protein [Aliifodinibius sp. S!AR15-10]MDR8391572.1 polyprenyl synthetase family protein [Aliifodinibius sp. S!AR15-10]
MKSTLKHQNLSELINRELADLNLPEEPGQLYEPVRYTLDLGGKRLRPYFTLISCGMCGGEVQEAVPAALAIELLHNFTLLHDDIMDAADTRRGQPSVFKKWNSSTAILSGDVMFAHSFEQLQHYGKSARYSKKQYATIMDIFLEAARTVCEGQAFDLEYAARTDVTIDEYLKMIRGKTAALISGSLMLGGAVADVDAEKLELLRRIGQQAGTAFQIQDDLLDVIADPKKFGKTPGGDIIEGKKTYLSILALQQGNKEQKTFINNVLAAQDIATEKVTEVIDLYEELGIVEKTNNAIEKHYAKSMELLDQFPESDYKTDLINYFNKLKNREF